MKEAVLCKQTLSGLEKEGGGGFMEFIWLSSVLNRRTIISSLSFHNRHSTVLTLLARQAKEEVLVVLQKPGDRARQGALRT